MALGTPTNLISGGNATASASDTTASFTPTANALVIATAFVARASNAPTTIAISSTHTGLTGSWTEVTLRNAGGTAKVSLFYRKAGASPSSGTITFTYSGASNPTRKSWIVDQVTGASGVSESATNETTGTSLTVTLGGIAGGNKSYGAVLSIGAGSITVGTGETEIIEATSTGTAEARSQTEYGTSTTPDWSGLSATVGSVGVAIEIQENINSTLTSAFASFALSGQTALLKVARYMSSAFGSFVLNGQNAIVKSTRKILASFGSYESSGLKSLLNTLGLTDDGAPFRQFVAQSFSSGAGGLLSYVDVELYGYSGGNVTAYLYASTGTVGVDARPTGSVLATSTNTINVSGFPPTPTQTLSRFTFTGATLSPSTRYFIVFNTTLGASDIFQYVDNPSNSESFATSTDGSSWTSSTNTSQQVELAIYSSFPEAEFHVERLMYATFDSYTLNGFDASLVFTHIIRLIADTGSYVLTGKDSLFALIRKLTASFASYTVTGQSSLFHVGLSMLAGVGSYVVTGIGSTLRKGISMVASFGSYTLTGFSATLIRIRNLIASSASYTVTGQASNLKIAMKMLATYTQYTLTGTVSILSYGRKIIASFGSYALTGFASTFSVHHVYTLIASYATYTVTTFSARFTRFWFNLTKNVSSWVNSDRVTTATMENTEKNTSTFTNTTRTDI